MFNVLGFDLAQWQTKNSILASRALEAFEDIT